MEGASLLARTAEPLIGPQPKTKAKKSHAKKTKGKKAVSAPRPRAVSPIGGAAVWSRLDFNMLHQEQSNWCWCATSLSVHRYYDPTSPFSQCQAANLILPSTAACTSPTSAAVNKPWYLDDALSDLGNLREPVVNGTVTWTAKAIEAAEHLPEVEAGNYELAVLRVPALYVIALWLKGTGAKPPDDIFIPLEPAPTGLTGGERVSARDFNAALVALKAERGKSTTTSS